MLRKILYKLFPPIELTSTIDAIKFYLDKNNCASKLIIEREAIRLAKKSPETIVLLIRIRHKTNTDAAHMMITLAILNILTISSHEPPHPIINVARFEMINIFYKIHMEMAANNKISKDDAIQQITILTEQYSYLFTDDNNNFL